MLTEVKEAVKKVADYHTSPKMPLPRHAIIAVTSATAPLHDGKPTGMFVSEVLHPYQVFTKAGFGVDLISEKGTYVPDWLSLQESFLSGEDKKQWEDESGEFRKKLDNMPDVSSLDGKDVGIALYGDMGRTS